MSLLPLTRAQTLLGRVAIGNVAYNIAVILWGAYVRATGSGAGCGEHWPTCNGEIVPRNPAIETVIEFTHRLTSGGALVLALAVWIAAFRLWPRGAPVRRAATWTMGFMVVESLVGAAIVLLRMTGQDDSIGRAAVMGVHLINTLLLVGAMLLTAWTAQGRPWPRWRTDRATAMLLGTAMAAMLVLGASGGITALGDTLFPADSLAEGIAQDFSPTAHILLRLRVLHPVLAVTIGGGTIVAALTTAVRHAGAARVLALLLVSLVIGQLGVGVANLLLLAPVWMQLVHLLMAEMVWIVLVMLAVVALAPVERKGPSSQLSVA